MGGIEVFASSQLLIATLQYSLICLSVILGNYFSSKIEFKFVSYRCNGLRNSIFTRKCTVLYLNFMVIHGSKI